MKRFCWHVVAAALLLGASSAGLAQAAAPEADEADLAPAPSKSAKARRGQPALRFGAENVLAEVGGPLGRRGVDAIWTLRASPYLLWQPRREWELRLGVLADASGQSGSPSFDRARADLADSYLRWRGGDTRLTVGAQTILWGRVDGIPLIDKVSRVDLTRLLLDDLPERRRAQWALRWEQSWEDVKLDTVVLPSFVGGELPPLESIWSPVDRAAGRVFGVAASPALAGLVRSASVKQDDGGAGGVALRLTRTGEPLDFGLIAGRTRQSLPYYDVDFARATMTAVHPYVSFVGADAEFVWSDVTWRTEWLYSRGVPLTSLAATRLKASSWEAVFAMEFFPGGKGTRVNLQLVTREARVDQPVLELVRYTGINGEIEVSAGQGRWKLGLQFASGLSVHDQYLGPRITYTGWEPHEVYLAAHVFRGNARSLGGFYADRDLVTMGLKSRF